MVGNALDLYIKNMLKITTGRASGETRAEHVAVIHFHFIKVQHCDATTEIVSGFLLSTNVL